MTADDEILNVITKTDGFGMIALHLKMKFFNFTPYNLKPKEWIARWGTWTTPSIRRNVYHVKGDVACDKDVT